MVQKQLTLVFAALGDSLLMTAASRLDMPDFGILDTEIGLQKEFLSQNVWNRWIGEEPSHGPASSSERPDSSQAENSFYVVQKTEAFEDHFKYVAPIGDGGQASVYRCINIRDAQFYAIKRIDKLRWKNAELETRSREVITEALVLYLLKGHKHVVEMYSVLEDTQYVYLVLELCEKGATTGQEYEEAALSNYIKQTLAVMQHIHGKGYTLCDLKPDNLLLTNDNVLKVCDFGGVVKSFSTETGSVIASTCGYYHPEHLANADPRTDYIALAMTAYTLCEGVLFAEKCNVNNNSLWSAHARGLIRYVRHDFFDMSQKKKILGGRVSTNFMSPDCKDFIVTAMLVDYLDDYDRDIRGHPWLHNTSARTNFPHKWQPAIGSFVKVNSSKSEFCGKIGKVLNVDYDCITGLDCEVSYRLQRSIICKVKVSIGDNQVWFHLEDLDLLSDIRRRLCQSETE